MKTKKLIGQILMLSMMSLISSSKDNKNLKCYTDLVEVITCVWNTSSVEDRFHITPTTNCFLTTKYENQNPQSNLEPLGSSQTKLRNGTLKFLEEALTWGALTVMLHVRCENISNPVETIPQFALGDHVKLWPPERPLVEGLNVTWKRGSPNSMYVKSVKYEVQWRLLEDSWKNDQMAPTEAEHYELLKEKLILGRQYVVRVRSSAIRQQEIWSEWSPVTQWTSTVGLQPPSEDPNYIILGIFNNLTGFILATVAVILLAFFCILRNSRILKCPYVPTPGKYFGDLFSDHGGDFKSWLGPIVNSEMYIKADSECISPVTIYNACKSDKFSNKMEKDFNIKDGSTSSFSNSTYFLSQTSKCALGDQLEPCSADGPYGPAGGGSVQEKISPATHDNGHENELIEVTMSTPLETSSSYKQLQKLRLDVQSPDSGFAGSCEEQESQEESGSEGLPSPPVVDNTLPINCILPCPAPQMIGFPHLIGIPSGLAWSPWNKQNFTNLPPDISRNFLLGNSGIMACSGMLEPSSDDYMPVKKVQG
ncbi:hypothetical protein AMELA_G00167080 [Ameiurus melas]|uniref:Interleukin-2 receptor subunit beta n=1 Tax=Ameiurus melas TaxID=219545 RepID=A0A7J6AFC2_AMEME|nr:hypothetical protein AMELA_G00167080 [Ameiurus melas]